MSTPRPSSRLLSDILPISAIAFVSLIGGCTAMLTVVASDLPPGAVAAGLERDALLAALKGHALGGQSLVGRYGR